MGSSESQNQQPITFSKAEIRELIEQNLVNNRLRLDHQSNIYQKCQYLSEKYKRYESQFDELYLSHNMISGEFMGLLSKMNLENLKTLSLSNNDISCQALNNFRFMKIRNLRYLFLDHNKIKNDGCYYLTRTNLQSLETLDISHNRIENEGCKHLAKANLPNLRTLLISNNSFTEKGLMLLSQGQWQLLAFVQAKQQGFEPNKQLQKVRFRSQVKVFRLQIQ